MAQHTSCPGLGLGPAQSASFLSVILESIELPNLGTYVSKMTALTLWSLANFKMVWLQRSKAKMIWKALVC